MVQPFSDMAFWKDFTANLAGSKGLLNNWMLPRCWHSLSWGMSGGATWIWLVRDRICHFPALYAQKLFSGIRCSSIATLWVLNYYTQNLAVIKRSIFTCIYKYIYPHLGRLSPFRTKVSHLDKEPIWAESLCSWRLPGHFMLPSLLPDGGTPSSICESNWGRAEVHAELASTATHNPPSISPTLRLLVFLSVSPYRKF